jgi:hypothetical protein
LVETFKYSFQNRAAKFTEIAYKIGKLDELLVEYVNKKKGRQARVGPALSHDDDDDVSGKPLAAPRKVRPYLKKN